MMTAISTTREGPIKTVVMANTMSLLTFLPAERNIILRTSLQAGGDFWIRVFLAKRLTPYARRLGYRVSKKWQTSKERQTAGPVMPFVGLTPPGGGAVAPGWSQQNGEKLAIAIRNARAQGMAHGIAKQQIIIRIPFGHPMRAESSATFRLVPSWELRRIADVVGQTLADIISSARLRPSTRPGRVTTQFSRTIMGASSRTISGGAPRKAA